MQIHITAPFLLKVLPSYDKNKNTKFSKVDSVLYELIAISRSFDSAKDIRVRQQRKIYHRNILFACMRDIDFKIWCGIDFFLINYKIFCIC